MSELECELDLTNQMKHLKEQINLLEEQNEFKQKTIADLAREKEKLSLDLRRQKRSNVNLKQQLEDERGFYLKEKEQYCQQMNEVKRQKRKEKRIEHESTDVVSVEETVAKNKQILSENAKLRSSLKEALEANYNLCVKFLRMKNSKFCIKSRLKKLQCEHDKVLRKFKMQIESSQHDLNVLIAKQASTTDCQMSSSNKKYLQIMKMNSHLLYENLAMQAQIDDLNQELDSLRTDIVRLDTCRKLKYIGNCKSECDGRHSAVLLDKESQTDIRLTDEILVSEYISTKFTNGSTIKSTLSINTEDIDIGSCGTGDLVTDFLMDGCEVVRTQSAPGIIENTVSSSKQKSLKK